MRRYQPACGGSSWSKCHRLVLNQLAIQAQQMISIHARRSITTATKSSFNSTARNTSNRLIDGVEARLSHAPIQVRQCITKRSFTALHERRSRMTRADDVDFSTRFAPKGKNARQTVARWVKFTVAFGLVTYGTIELVKFMTTMMDKGSGAETEGSGGLHARVFKPFEIVDKQDVSSTAAIFILRRTGARNSGSGSSARLEHKLQNEAYSRRAAIQNVEKAIEQSKKKAEADEHAVGDCHESELSVLQQQKLRLLKAYGEAHETGFRAQWEQGLWSVEFKQPQLQIARSYTPLPPTSSMEAGDLRFLIRREHKGEVSNYLSNIPVGGSIGVRGPRMEYPLPQDVTEVVFLAGGTGIAPALQLVHTLFSARTDCQESPPKVRILWANRRREDCAGMISARQGWFPFWNSPQTSSKAANILVNELQGMEKQYSKLGSESLSVDYFCDEEGSFITTAAIRAACASGKPPVETTGKKLLIISGPEGFVQHFAGPKEWREGVEVQGPVGGEVRKLKLKGWSVIKL